MAIIREPVKATPKDGAKTLDLGDLRALLAAVDGAPDSTPLSGKVTFRDGLREVTVHVETAQART